MVAFLNCVGVPGVLTRYESWSGGAGLLSPRRLQRPAGLATGFGNQVNTRASDGLNSRSRNLLAGCPCLASKTVLNSISSDSPQGRKSRALERRRRKRAPAGRNSGSLKGPSRKNIEDTSLRGLALWRGAAVKVSIEKVVPLRFSQDPSVDSRALLGDCVLKGYMLEYIFAHEREEQVNDKGYLTARLGEALSNRNMLLHASDILPPRVFDFMSRTRCSQHEFGTAVEAMVFEVRDNKHACQALAHHLLKWSAQAHKTANWKGLFLEQLAFSPEFEVVSVDGLETHRPRWVVSAKLHVQSGTVEGIGRSSSKKMAEQEAAREALMHVVKVPLAPEEELVREKLKGFVNATPNPIHVFNSDDLGQDSPIRAANADITMLMPVSYLSYNLSTRMNVGECGNAEEWFHTRPRSKRFSAVMNAQYIFPGVVHSVKSWRGSLNEAPAEPTQGEIEELFHAEDFSKAETGDEADVVTGGEVMVLLRIEFVSGDVEMAAGAGPDFAVATMKAAQRAHQAIRIAVRLSQSSLPKVDLGDDEEEKQGDPQNADVAAGSTD
uniref:DRBM domain-containing protein n=1 Tax=Tetraselmis sp. GSL018 TaxID=582737 RepID=A0A061S2B2_9CHLO|mmetsp:Transcript_26984/g.64012  ORF Transcript_26984/g.64012 Transcript_26984/m.64012 type:complete len:551 (-) Transcript_26984:212-1864(-)